MVTDSHSILARWVNHFLLLLNVHGVNEVRQTEIHIAELLMPELSAFEFEMAMESSFFFLNPPNQQVLFKYQ